MVMTPYDRSSGCDGGIIACTRGTAVVAFVILGWASVAGCGRRGLPDIVPVVGHVAFAGGACPAAGCVYFLPAGGQPDAAARPRAGWARFERDGRYSATTLVHDDGLLPGLYDVRVDCRAPAQRSGHDAGSSHVSETLTLPRLIVPSGSRAAIEHDIDVVVRAGVASGTPSAGGQSHADAP